MSNPAHGDIRIVENTGPPVGSRLLGKVSDELGVETVHLWSLERS